MKRLLSFLFFASVATLSFAQQPANRAKFKALRDLDTEESCYTFKSNGVIIKICKGDEASQLFAYGPKELWLGRNYRGLEYSEIVITFSKPVSCLNFVMSHFNNDSLSGNEQVDQFHLYTGDNSEIQKYNMNWSAGSNAYPLSNQTWTTFDPVHHIIKATEGAFGEQASGRLSISSNTPFTKITFRQTILRGYPNGIIINDAINYTLASDTVIKESTPDTLTVEELKTVSTVVVPDTTKTEKQEVVSIKETKTDSVIKEEVKTIKQVKQIKPVKKPVITSSVTQKQVVKKTMPVPAKIKKSTSVKKTVVRSEPVTQTTQKKIATTKTQAKKKTVAKPVVKEKTDSMMTYKLSEIKQLKVGEKIKLERVYFKQSLPELLPDSYPELDTLANILKQYPSLEIELQGHTDNQGIPALNQKLSEQRVEAVKEYLVTKGIAAARLTGKGFGSSKPYTDNNSEEHRHQNRRVEFMITKR